MAGLENWQWLQKRFEKLGIHRKQPGGLNICICEVTGGSVIDFVFSAYAISKERHYAQQDQTPLPGLSGQITFVIRTLLLQNKIYFRIGHCAPHSTTAPPGPLWSNMFERSTAQKR